MKILCPKDPDFYTPLALKMAKGQRLQALEVYKNQSPIKNNLRKLKKKNKKTKNKNLKAGGQNVSCDFVGGGKRTIERALQNQFWRPQKVGITWSVPVSSKENNRAKTNGGGGNVS